MINLTRTPVTLIGASRGLGRVLAETFHRLGAQVLVVARGQADLDILARDLPGVAVLACDASAEDAPQRVLAVQAPRILILCGGAMPPCRPLPDVDWEEFSGNWNNDVRMSFHFLQSALKRSLPPGATIVTITSGAVRQGSPISGGYAGAKQMQIFMTGYAQKAADRAGIDLRFLSLAPARLMPQTDIGAAGVKGYAAYNGTSEAAFLEAMGQGLAPRQVADAVLDLIGEAPAGGNLIVSPDRRGGAKLMGMEISITAPDASGAPDASNAFSALADSMRGELKRHCYRMMGGAQDAEDCVQETLLRGWREFASLRDGTAGRPWLYSIATRVCLDALRKRRRRQTLFGPSLDEVEPGTEQWVEPWPGGVPGPERGQDIRLAFVSLLHGLPPRGRALLLLHDGVGMTASEAAAALGISVAGARSALQRARTALPIQDVVAAGDVPIEAYVNAWNAGDVAALIGLLHRDIVMTMPPWHRTFIGRDEVARFMTDVWPHHEGFRAIAVVANGQPAAAVYTRRNGASYLPHSLHVLAGGGQVGEMVLYAPPLGASLFAAFGLPPTV